MFGWLKKKKAIITIPALGEFKVIENNGESKVEGRYESKVFGSIELSFPTNNVSNLEHQISLFNRIETNWKNLAYNLPQGFQVESIMIPEYNSYEYDGIEAEVVLSNKKKIISAIINEGKIEEIIEI